MSCISARPVLANTICTNAQASAWKKRSLQEDVQGSSLEGKPQNMNVVHLLARLHLIFTVHLLLQGLMMLGNIPELFVVVNPAGIGM